MQDHVHLREGPGCVIHFLSVDADAVGCFIGGFQQQGAGAACRIIEGLVAARPGGSNADDFCDDARDLGGRIELPFTLAGLGSKMWHGVLVRVTEQVMAFGAVRAEIKGVEDTHQFREPVLHLLPAAEFTFVIEICRINDTFEVIRLGESCDDFVDFIADVLMALECYYIGEPAAFWHDERAVRPGIFIRDIFHKQQRRGCNLYTARHPSGGGVRGSSACVRNRVVIS